MLEHGPDLRRWDKRIIGRTNRLLVRSRHRATFPVEHSNQIIAVGVRALPTWDQGLRRVLPTIPTNRLGVISFAAAGAGESWLSSDHVSIDSSRGRFV